MKRPRRQFYTEISTLEDKIKFDYIDEDKTAMAWFEKVDDEWEMMTREPSDEELNELIVLPF